MKRAFYYKYVGLNWYCEKLFNCSYSKFIDVMVFEFGNDIRAINCWLKLQESSKYGLTHEGRLNMLREFLSLLTFVYENDVKNLLKTKIY